MDYKEKIERRKKGLSPLGRHWFGYKPDEKTGNNDLLLSRLYNTKRRVSQFYKLSKSEEPDSAQKALDSINAEIEKNIRPAADRLCTTLNAGDVEARIASAKFFRYSSNDVEILKIISYCLDRQKYVKSML